MPPTPQQVFKETQVSKLGGAPRHPLLHQTIIRSSLFDAIFVLLRMICDVLGASLLCFQFLFCFVCWSLQCWTLACLFGRDTRCTLSQNTLELHLYLLSVQFIYCLFVSSCSSLISCLRAINLFCRKYLGLSCFTYICLESCFCYTGLYVSWYDLYVVYR